MKGIAMLLKLMMCGIALAGLVKDAMSVKVRITYMCKAPVDGAYYGRHFKAGSYIFRVRDEAGDAEVVNACVKLGNNPCVYSTKLAPKEVEFFALEKAIAGLSVSTEPGPNEYKGTASTNETPCSKPQPCFGKIDLLFLMDAADPETPTQWEQEKEFVTDVASDFAVGPDKTRLASISFGAAIQSESGFAQPRSTNLAAFESYVLGLSRQVTSKKDISEAGFEVMKLFDNAPSGSNSKVIVLVTDGNPTEASRLCKDHKFSASPIECAREVFEELVGPKYGAKFFYVVVGQRGNRELFKDVATKTVDVEDYNKLGNFVDSISQEICSITNKRLR